MATKNGFGRFFMKSNQLRPRLAAITAIGACLMISTAEMSGAVPALNVQRDPSGAKITWNAADGLDYVLEASNDLRTWTLVNQSIVKEGGLHRAFVPDSEAMNFYRLVNDGRKQAAYVGSEACSTCHSETYGQFIESGHPYKLVKVKDGQPPK